MVVTEPRMPPLPWEKLSTTTGLVVPSIVLYSKERSTIIGRVEADDPESHSLPSATSSGSASSMFGGTELGCEVGRGDGNRGGRMVWTSASTSDLEVEDGIKTAEDGVKIDAVISSVLDSGREARDVED